MSPTRLPGIITAMAAARASSATSIRREADGEIAPTPAVKAASPCQPSTMAPQSIDTMSPSSSVSAGPSPGMPCTTTSLIEAQITAG